MAVLVSFKFRSIPAFFEWLKLSIPFGHSFWAFLSGMWAFEQMLIVWVVGFGGDEGATPRTALRMAWARELWFNPKWITSSFSSWVYFEWDTLILRVSD